MFPPVGVGRLSPLEHTVRVAATEVVGYLVGFELCLEASRAGPCLRLSAFVVAPDPEVRRLAPMEYLAEHTPSLCAGLS